MNIKFLVPEIVRIPDFNVSASSATEIVTLAGRIQPMLLKRGLAKYPSAILWLSLTVDSNFVINLYFSALRTFFHHFIECCKVDERYELDFCC